MIFRLAGILEWHWPSLRPLWSIEYARHSDIQCCSSKGLHWALSYLNGMGYCVLGHISSTMTLSTLAYRSQQFASVSVRVETPPQALVLLAVVFNAWTWASTWWAWNRHDGSHCVWPSRRHTEDDSHLKMAHRITMCKSRCKTKRQQNEHVQIHLTIHFLKCLRYECSLSLDKNALSAVPRLQCAFTAQRYGLKCSLFLVFCL